MGVAAAGPPRVALVGPASAPLPDPNSSRSLDAHLASLRSDLEQARQSGNQAKDDLTVG